MTHSDADSTHSSGEPWRRASDRVRISTSASVQSFIWIQQGPRSFWRVSPDSPNSIEVKGRDRTVLYSVYDYDKFEGDLMDNTRLEEASRTRYRFGDFYREQRDVCIKLNLQIRLA